MQQCRRNAETAADSEREHDDARMFDGRVRQQPLEVVLYEHQESRRKDGASAKPGQQNVKRGRIVPGFRDS